jgi:hypothetical protein
MCERAIGAVDKHGAYLLTHTSAPIKKYLWIHEQQQTIKHIRRRAELKLRYKKKWNKNYVNTCDCKLNWVVSDGHFEWTREWFLWEKEWPKEGKYYCLKISIILGKSSFNLLNDSLNIFSTFK